jgi:hypothetical protein
LERREVPVDALAAEVGQDAAPPELHFIWHTSFCCSTLLADTLDLPGRVLSLREPLVLVPVADTKRAVSLMKRPMPPRLIEIVFRLLGRARGEKVVVKPSNFANVLVQEAARHCHGKVLFLYTDLEGFLISIEKGGESLRKYARRLFSNIAGDGGAALPWPPQDVFKMSDLEIAALAWHMQIAEFRRSARVLGPARAAALDCEAFLNDPAGTLGALDTFFELGLGAGHIAHVVAGPLLKRHAKVPSHAFNAERRRALSDNVRARLGAELQRLVDWSYSACPDTPRGAPLVGACAAIGEA